MITVVRIELSDNQRNVLGRKLYPNSPARLASRKDVTEYLEGCMAAAVIEDVFETIVSSGTTLGDSRNSRLLNIMERERSRDARLQGKSDSYIRGWCKVKYQDEIRGA